MPAPKISLCLICGNEAAVIERCLTNFAPAFDELSICRAIGSLKPDDTIELAKKWCAANGKGCVVSIYTNDEPETQGWPHVDSFCAARNMAFQCATGDWLFWADCDDTASADIGDLRKHAETGGENVIFRFPYDVLGTGKKPFRERLLRKSLFDAGRKWRFDVHENLLGKPGDKYVELEAPVWFHAPAKAQDGNRDRNIRIMSRTLNTAPTLFFYWSQELKAKGNFRDAQKVAALVVQMPYLEPSFRYEAALNLTRMERDNEVALRHALSAYEVFPWCREAVAEILKIYIDLRALRYVRHWAKVLERTPEPPEAARPWTHEPKWYGWAANDLLAQAWRLCGDEAAAEAWERSGPKPVFSLLHATRGRPQRATNTRSQWIESAANPAAVEHIFAVDADDPKAAKLRQFRQVKSGVSTCVSAWNEAAKVARGEILVQLSDDFEPVMGWDALILAEIERAGKRLTDPFVVAVSDGHRNDDLLCMAIVSRARWQHQGHLFAPEYESMYSDNEFSFRAFRDGVVIDARPRITFRHDHPLFTGAPADETYARQNAPEKYERGRAVFEARNPEAVKETRMAQV